MSERVRIGVVGAGMIAQVEHLPNLVALRDRFDLVGVADPSPRVRAAVAARHEIAAVESLPDLVALGLDALLVATPDPLHAATVLAGLDAGLHVFCEKPLCYTEREAAEIIERRDRDGLVVQVGYMKRFDPNYEAALGCCRRAGGGCATSRSRSATPTRGRSSRTGHCCGRTTCRTGWSTTRVPGSGRRWQRRWEWRWTERTCAATPTR